MAVQPSQAQLQLARSVRERFLAELGKAMVDIAGAVLERLTALMEEPSNAREAQTRRDVWMAYKRCRPVWQDNTTKAWREELQSSTGKKKDLGSLDAAGLELVGTEVFENKILASRMVMAVMEKVNADFDDLRLRVKFLEGAEDLADFDILRPDVPVLKMVEQWGVSGMPADSWPMVSDVVQGILVASLKTAYKNGNALLIQQGVMPTIEFKDRIRGPRIERRAQPPVAAPQASPDGAPSQPDGYGGYANAPMGGGVSQGYGVQGGALAGWGAGPANAGAMGYGAQGAPAAPSGGFFSRPATGAPAGGGGDSVPTTDSQPFWRQGGAGSNSAAPSYYGADAGHGLAQPLARARARAQGVIGQIRRFFINQGGGDIVAAPGAQAVMVPSPALMQAIAQQPLGPVMQNIGASFVDYSPVGMAQVATELREKTTELKKKAETKGEKATIEIVALMFQAILAEDRIPPGIRVWIARLQMPVLRIALEDADFLGTTTHPARMLIDRMGSVVLGFDAAGGHGTAMEVEIKRIVQVIEQYPETGKKVYQVVYDEFQKFLEKFLTEKGAPKQVMSVAQQVEQKETLAIQFTIEMRNLLRDMPVRDEIRSFLFKVWAEVLAVAAVRRGPKHADTITLKKTASDLIWSASAKPNRTDRAKVIQELPNLLLRLRSGMTLLGVPPSEQDAHIKSVSDTLQDAFLSKTQAIEQGKIDALAQRLGNLEEFISEDGVGDLPLDAESIEMMLGMDASGLEVITNGGSKPTAAMMAWAQELQVGSWYTLDHNKQKISLQLVWRSERKHLNLFAAVTGRAFLIQAGRLAAYLQAGLLEPQEDEALTVRATRDALNKLEANPERVSS
ncbi:DUF1631 family protein [Curvibacter sp. APW13]|uniref:DUF1631 family protein n=1 Tax=Curvibacter sp. APW13 TaxID=3077236 RepID=UPI0028DEDCA4|nr:DUF1631 family protein [Curvibacter sp. APW13]MDT8990117.1 DUF1631 family protein [Curvibacter sp. APW13]